MATIALIGGTGLDDWGGEAARLTTDTPFGVPSGAIAEYAVAGHRILFLPRHGSDHAIPPHRVNYRANLHALHDMGARLVVAINAVGSMNDHMPPSALVVPDQLIDYTWGREHTYCDGEAAPLDHAEFGRPFNGGIRRQLSEAGQSAGVRVVDGGCIGVTQGPRLETEAEVRRLARDGCDLVGMTSMPEAALARELGMSYASLCVVANWAAGIDDGVVSLADIEATLGTAMKQARRVLLQFFELT